MAWDDQGAPCDAAGHFREEEKVTERVDDQGNIWRKVYFGGGAHFRNWLEQCRELGEVMVEEVESSGRGCFAMSGEKLYRIWVKIGGSRNDAG